MDTPQERFDETMMDYIARIAKDDPESDEFGTAVKNLETFSKLRPPAPEPKPEPQPETRWGKVKAGFARAWDNETTRTFIKAGGAFGGVALVTWTTAHKDRVIERQALSQANQRNS